MASSPTSLSLDSDVRVEEQGVNFGLQVIGRENVTFKEEQMQILKTVIVEKKLGCPGRAANRFWQVVSLSTYGTLHRFRGIWLQTDRN